MTRSMKRNENKCNYSCPRCGGSLLIDYGDNFDCIECQLEFEKKDVDECDDGEVLAVQEKSALFEKLRFY